jgi:hypothetical protein
MIKTSLNALCILLVNVSRSTFAAMVPLSAIDMQQRWLDQNPVKSEIRDGTLYVGGYSTRDKKWVETKDEKCSICKSPYEVGGRIAILPCGHVLCFKCYNKNTTKKCHSCPESVANDPVLLRVVPLPQSTEQIAEEFTEIEPENVMVEAPYVEDVQEQYLNVLENVQEQKD